MDKRMDRDNKRGGFLIGKPPLTCIFVGSPNGIRTRVSTLRGFIYSRTETHRDASVQVRRGACFSVHLQMRVFLTPCMDRSMDRTGSHRGSRTGRIINPGDDRPTPSAQGGLQGAGSAEGTYLERRTSPGPGPECERPGDAVNVPGPG